MDIVYIDKDYQYQNAQTVYWFSVNGERFGLADHRGSLTLLDSEGYPIDPCNDHDNVKSALIPLYHAHSAY